MKVSTLKNKLNKMGVKFTEICENGYNKDLVFSINNIEFKAGFTKNTVEDFCREFDFEQDFQETRRRFFKNFNSLLKYSQSK